MKETNLPETPWNSWQPRRPSAGLKHRIFSAAVAPAEGFRLELTWTFRWLAPAAACLLLALSALNQQREGATALSTMESVAVLSLSNRSYAPYLPDSREQGRNTFSAVTFEWTNRSRSTSSIGSFSPDKAN